MSIYLGTNKVAMSMDTVIPYKPGYLRTDAELVKTITYDKLAVTDEGYTIPEYTTTSTTYIASESLTDTVALDLSTYNYFITEVFFSYPTYNITTTAKGRVEYYFGVQLYELVDTIGGSTFHGLLNPALYSTQTYTVNTAGSQTRLVYYSAASTISTYSTSAYGIVQAAVAPTTTATVLTLKSPNMIIRGHATYFASTYFSAVTDIRNQYKIKVYRIAKNSAQGDGWGTRSLILNTLPDIYSNTRTLT